MEQLKIWTVFLVASSVLWSVNSQCPTRNQTAADIVGRPCRKPCRIGSNDCRDGKICRCDHECGSSCINLENLCSTPPFIDNFAQIRISRQLDNGTLVRVQSQQLRYRYDDIAEFVCRPGFSASSSTNYNYCHGRKGWTRTAECILSCSGYNVAKVLLNGMICGSNCTRDADCGNTFQCQCDGACGKTCISRNATCENLTPPSHAEIDYSREGVNRRAKYICNDGYYRRSGSSARRCTGGGSWEGLPANCQRITCSNPQSTFGLTRGSITNYQAPPFYVGHRLQFECPSTHRLVGSHNRTCEADGQWSGMISLCDLKDNLTRCSHPGIPVNGHLLNVTTNFSIGSLVEFECNAGYVMIGDWQQECLFFLEWSGNGAPKCIDPKLPFSFDGALRSLEASVEDSISSARRSITGENPARTTAVADQNIEVLFAVDLSSEVSLTELENSLAFAQEHVKKVSVGGRIRCAIILFASQVNVYSELRACDLHFVNETIDTILIDRANIINRVGSGRNTAAVLSKITELFTLSLLANGESNRRIFLLVNGLHNEGEPPISVIQRLHQGLTINVPEINVIAYGDEATSVEAFQELRALAIPIDRFLVNPPLASTVRPSEEMDKCGLAGNIGGINGRLRVRNVIGGDMANVGAWPWHAVVSTFRDTVRSSYRTTRGGGSLINSQWVLTAAHLFDGISRSIGWERHFLVSFGITTLPQLYGTTLPSYAQVFQAAEIITHLGYNENTLDYDIALIKVGPSYQQAGDSWIPVPFTRVAFTRHVRPVCLPCMESSCTRSQLRKNTNFNETDSIQEQCKSEGEWLLQKDLRNEKNFMGVVSGFGAINRQNRVVSTFLKQGRIRLLNNETCLAQRSSLFSQLMELGQTLNALFTNNMICGVGGTVQNITDACRGDSGGAYVRQVRDSETGESCWVQIGIVSWGYGCGETFHQNGVIVRYPGYYTNVLAFADWIKNETAECPSRNLNAIEQGRSCRKACNSTADCTGQLKRCVCDDNCGMSCFNPNAECDINSFPNGRITGNRTYGSIITYQCSNGYTLQGNNIRRCRSDKEWSGSVPTCMPVSCPPPASPQNGRVNDVVIEYSYNNEVTYQCNQGYRIEGSATGRCNENSTWGEVPSCVLDIDCDFENFRRPFCSYTVTGHGWEREFSTNVNSGARAGYVARVSSSSIQNNQEAKLISPAVTREISKCVKFHYMLQTLSVNTDFSLSLLPTNGQSNTVWTPHRSDPKNQWLSAVVLLGESNTDVQLEFIAGNLQTTVVDIDDVMVSDQCENFCSPSPCQGGTCYNRIDGYQCYCLNGFSGADCSIRATSCALPTPPTNGRITGQSGTSVAIGGTVTLRCNDNYIFAHLDSSVQSLRCEAGAVWSHAPQTTCIIRYRCRSDDNLPCVFPFQYRGDLYYSCASRIALSDWCSKTSNWDIDRLHSGCINCPIRWGQWSTWGRCSVTCGTGQQVRIRACNNGEPGSAYCVGPSVMTKSCEGETICPVSEIRVGNSVYGIFHNAASYDRAATHCIQYGGGLASIPNATYNEALTEEIQSLPLLGLYHAYFIGLSDRTSEGRWNWPGRTVPSEYTNWNEDTQEPKGGRNENCATFLRNGKWNDRSCAANLQRPLYFICERSLVSSWNTWGSCSNVCGNGEQTRTRSCLNALGISLYCPDLTERQDCVGNSACRNPTANTDRWGAWSTWGPCSTTCGNGVQTRSRTCNVATSGSGNCIGSTTSTRPCENTTPCSGPEISVGRKVYRVVLETKTHTRARQFCQSLGSNGDLAVLKSSTVRTQVLNTLRGITTLPEDSIRQFFFGLYLDEANVWRWVDNALLQTSETNWGDGEPNNYNNNQGCASMQRATGEWNDVPCSFSLPYLCERDRELNPCASMPCKNEGTCENDGSRFLCFCHLMVAGDNCEIVLNQCFSSPCQNGATCTGTRYSYTCACNGDWTGTNCEQSL